MSSLREAFKGHPVYVQNLPDINFATVSEVPDSYSWPTLDRLTAVGEAVPVIDLTSPDVVTQLGNACHKWGVFQVLNHGVDARLLDSVESESWRLFSLPADQKVKAARLPDGATGYGTARISTFFSKEMWSEGFTIVGSPLDHAQNLWPDDHSHFW